MMSTEMQDEPSALESYGAYPFDSDQVYQQGLASILAAGTIGADAAPEVREEMIRRTRVFYFNKVTGSSITMEEARHYEHSRSLREPSASASLLPPETEAADMTNDESRVLTFAELKELIESGNVDKIPNNKIIPEGINEAPPSSSVAPARRKPWESAAILESESGS